MPEGQVWVGAQNGGQQPRDSSISGQQERRGFPLCVVMGALLHYTPAKMPVYRGHMGEGGITNALETRGFAALLM